ncbi:Tryptophan 2,3-dioxygenase [Halotydeus destructor]|nr:Tryptophan 2,3-dioxygenase [Halotydeus destructor]
MNNGSSEGKVNGGLSSGHSKMDENTCREIPKGGMLYGEYLMLDDLLKCQMPVTTAMGSVTHDEHLFIITHQAYELWFKQIIYELDSVRHLLDKREVSETNMLMMTSRLSRINLIWKLLVDQVSILETMTPLDFFEFRASLAPASGFQSVQFRLIENKLGVKNTLRTNYGKNSYLKIFEDPKVIETVQRSEEEPSLLNLIETWLERTPGIDEKDFDFWSKYTEIVNNMIESTQEAADAEDEPVAKELLLDEYKRKKELFDSILDVTKHNALVARGERRFSHKAFQGMLMISLYRDEPRFNQPYHILTLLMDIDSLITKWRYNHVQMVLRMLGSQQMGTGGSSGYHYLRSTLSDRYKVFMDICNLSSFLIPRSYIPPLTARMKKRLSIMEDISEKLHNLSADDSDHCSETS